MEHDDLILTPTRDSVFSINTAKERTTLGLQFKAGIEPELLKLAKKKATRPDRLDETPPFFWFAEASNSLVNSYYLRFQRPMLKSWVDTGKEGISFLAHHKDNDIIGQSIYAWYEEGVDAGVDGRERDRLIVAFYTLPGIKLGSIDTDSFIAAVEGGVMRDVSIGAMLDDVRCSICDADPRDFWGKLFGTAECMHWLGESYDIKDPKDENKILEKDVIALGDCYAGRLLETSQVFKGAAPLASAISPIALSHRDHLLDAPLQARLEKRFGVDTTKQPDADGIMQYLDELPKEDAERIVRESSSIRAMLKGAKVFSASGTGGKPVGQQAAVATLDATELLKVPDELVSLLVECGIYEKDDEVPETFVEAIGDMALRFTELQEDAQTGREMKAEAIEDALAQGVRAFGNDFKREVYQRNLERSDIEGIKQQRDDWTKIGDARLAAGGENPLRLTPEGGEAPAPAQKKSRRKVSNRQFAS